MNEEENKRLEIQKLDDEEFQEEISELVNNAEKMVRDFNIDFKKALKEGTFLEEHPYYKIIEIYEDIKNALIKRGWNDQISIYNNQIRIYQKKLKNHNKIREIEKKKNQDKENTASLHKISIKESENVLTSKDIGLKQKQEIDDKNFEEYIDKQVNHAERIAREYEIQLKRGNFDIECPYEEIMNIYRKIRDELHKYGWNEESLIYTNQIKLYKTKLEKDIRLREIEKKKSEEKQKLEKIYRFNDKLIQETEPKISKGIQQKERDEIFQDKITKMVDHAEKLAREYDNKLKKGDFETEPIYPEVIKIYREIRKKLLDKGWKDQAAIYLNQIQIYKEKIEKVQKLREIEVQKLKRQKEIEDMQINANIEQKDNYDVNIQEIKRIEAEKEEKLEKAMNIINEAEKKAKSYELKLKSKLTDFESPYSEVINYYKEAKILLLDIGWNNEADNIDNTIQYYTEKKEKDDRIRKLEIQKKEEKVIHYPLDKNILEEIEKENKNLFLDIENKKKQNQKIFNDIFEMINKADQISKSYDDEILKQGILNLECPYDKIIEIYNNAKKKFEQNRWLIEAKKLDESIEYFKKKIKEDKKIRENEIKKIKEKEQAKLEEELLIEKTIKEKEERLKKEKQQEQKEKLQSQEFEIQKKRAFEFMDRAKKELEDNNFDNALNLYKKSENIFENLEWKAGISLIKDSIDLIKNKKLSHENEQKEMERLKSKQIKLEQNLEKEINKINEMEKLEKIRKEDEIKKRNALKEKQEEISDRAYTLLKKGSKLVETKNFNDAYKLYIEARKLFQEIDWQTEVNRIDQELLVNLNKKRDQALRLEKYQRKKEKEEKDLKQLLNIAEEQKKELNRIEIEERRKKIAKEQKKLPNELELAEILIKNYRYNETILKLSERLVKLEQTNKIKQIGKIKSIINHLKNQTKVPLIVLEKSHLKNTKEFKISYEALDRAQKSIMKNNLMKAISELNEAKYNLEKINAENTILNKIEDTINIYRNQIGIDIVEPSDIITENQQLEDLKLKIAQTRAKRRKRVKELKKEE
ncbi:MAG: hypothetical protein JXA99_06475 [Candidatus Lokiarchaeota archaeon]|nr:hypothetical protein [Candidatus Lokiarchaeota archaeon]